MVDFTGGCTEIYDLKSDDCPKDLMTIVLKAYQRHSMMGCSIGIVAQLSNFAKSLKNAQNAFTLCSSNWINILRITL